MSSTVSDDNVEKKFQLVLNTQDSIQTLSLWILHHKAHHQKIVSCWMKVLKKAKISHRLTLFYLANDVVQNGKRKGVLQFGNSFAEVLREATLLVRDEQIRPNVQRVFKIWEDRNVYSPEFIADLSAILANAKVPSTAHSKLLAEFKPETVIEKLRLVMKLEIDAATKTSMLNLSKLNATNAEIVQQLKDRNHGQQFKREFDDNNRSLEELIKLLNREVKERTDLILLLEQSEIYYDTQRGEAKIVANAYKNFGARVKTLQKKLEELTATFPSPLPSPSPDAPSPTTSDQELELNLPIDQTQTNELENLENVPSPEGTPEGLNLSSSTPSPPPTTTTTATPIKTETQPVTTQSVGNPIPTLSNFFSHDQGGMTSWLDTFTKKKSLPTITEVKIEAPKTDTSSLDSRLSNLLQNIPNLPSGLQSTIFGNSASGNNTPLRDSANSPQIGKKEIDPLTAKEENSGQNTPLQDEESTHSNHAIFPKVSSSSSSSKPKDILSSLIKSVGNDKSSDNFKSENYSYSSQDSFNPTGMTSFIQNIIPPVSHSSPTSFFNTTQGMSIPVQTMQSAQTLTINSYQSAYSSKTSNRNSSFIPSIVPSMMQNDYGYNNYSTNEYNPELETFDDDQMELGIPLVDELDQQSPTLDSLSPVPSPDDDDELSQPNENQRFSTLITVVTKDSPDISLPSPQNVDNNGYAKSDEENKTEESPWENLVPPPNPNNVWDTLMQQQPVIQQEAARNVSPTEEFFIGKEAASLPTFFTIPPNPGQTNGGDMSFINHPPPENFKSHPPPENFRSNPLPENFRSNPPPENFRSNPPPEDFRSNPPPEDFRSKSSPENFTSNTPPDNFRSNPPPENFVNNPTPENFISNPTPENFISNPTPENFISNPPPENFISNPPPENFKNHPQPENFNPPSENFINHPPPDTPPRNIQIVQFPSDHLNGSWFDNNWAENERMPFPPPMHLMREPPPPLPCGILEPPRFFEKRNFPPQNFRPRNNWAPRHRPDHSFHRPYGPRPNRFPFRGRGRGPRHYSNF